MKVCLECGGRFTGGDWTCPGCGFAPQRRDGLWLFAPDLAHGDGSDAEYRIAALVDAEAWHFWFTARRRLLLWAVRRYFPGARSFCEIGCGAGAFLAALHQAQPDLAVVASDLLAARLAEAGRLVPGVPLLQLDARRIPFEREFDLVGAFDVLEHVTEDEAVLRAAHRSLTDSGGLILTVPQHPWLWSAWDDYSHHRRRYRRAELIEKLRAAGFTVLRTTSFFSFTVPLIWLRRLRTRARAVDPEEELRVGRRVNAVLRWMATLERRLIEGGLSLPAGGSLLVVARRSASPDRPLV